jgi:O-antigen ligase
MLGTPTKQSEQQQNNFNQLASTLFDGSIFRYVLTVLVVCGAFAVGSLGSAIFPEYAQFLLMAPFALILGLVMLVRPEVAMFLTVVYIPFDNWQMINLPGGLSISKMLGLVLLGVFAFNIVLRQRRFRVFDDPQDFVIVLFAGVLLLSGVVSEFQNKTFSEVDRMIRIMAFYLATKNLLSTPQIIFMTMWGLLLTITYASGWGINEYYAAKAVRIHDIRIGGIGMNPNAYAAMTVVGMWIGVHLFDMTRNIFIKVPVAIMTGIMLYGILLSGSRGAMLAIAVTGAIYIWRHPRRNMLFVAGIAAVIFSFPMWPENIRVRIVSVDDPLSQSTYAQTTEHSTDRRLSYQTFGLGLLAESPLLGTGYRTFSLLYPSSDFAQLDNPMTGNQRFRVAHNSFLEVASGAGLIGLTLYVLIFLFSWLALFRVRRQFKRGTLLWGAASAFELGMISLAITSLFLSIEHFQMTWFVIAMSSALAFQMRVLPHQYREDLKPKQQSFDITR